MADTGSSEQPPKGNFLQRLARRTPDKPAVSSHPSREMQPDFESQLFRNGTLDFDFDQYMAEARQDLGRSSNRYEQNPYLDAQRTTESMARDMDNAKYEMIWRSRFSGQIPKQWHIWYNVRGDFEKAKEAGARLSETLVDAGVSHPHHLVANEVGKGQMLNTKQLAWLFVRPDFPNWNRDEILAAQRKMGVREDDLREAMRMADEVREQARKQGSGSYTLEDASSHFEQKKLQEGKGE